MQIVYHIPFAHSNPLPVEGIVLGHLHHAHARLGPGSGVAHLVCGTDAEGVGVARFAGILVAGGLGGGEQAGPVDAVLAHFQVVTGYTRACRRVIAASGDGDGGDAAAHRGGKNKRYPTKENGRVRNPACLLASIAQVWMYLYRSEPRPILEIVLVGIG